MEGEGKRNVEEETEDRRKEGDIKRCLTAASLLLPDICDMYTYSM